MGFSMVEKTVAEWALLKVAMLGFSKVGKKACDSAAYWAALLVEC
jgi:hypothetical protein